MLKAAHDPSVTHFLAQPGLYILPAPEHAVFRLLELLKRSAVTGGDIFDLQIVATMKDNMKRIYTFNAADFRRFPELVIVTPS